MCVVPRYDIAKLNRLMPCEDRLDGVDAMSGRMRCRSGCACVVQSHCGKTGARWKWSRVNMPLNDENKIVWESRKIQRPSSRKQCERQISKVSAFSSRCGWSLLRKSARDSKNARIRDVQPLLQHEGPMLPYSALGRELGGYGFVCVDESIATRRGCPSPCIVFCSGLTSTSYLQPVLLKCAKTMLE